MAESIEERIRERAYHLWEAEGRPPGRAEAHWLRAEAEVKGAAESQAPRPAARPAKAKAKPDTKPKAKAGAKPGAGTRKAGAAKARRAPAR